MIRHLAVLWAVAAALGAHGTIKVEVAAVEGGYTLVRDGVPYLVKGAGIGGVDVATVAEHGGNSRCRRL